MTDAPTTVVGDQRGTDQPAATPVGVRPGVTQGLVAASFHAAVRSALDGVRAGLAALFEVRVGDHVFAREVTVGGGHAGGQITAEHFGLGQELSAQIRVIWPDQTVSDWREVGAGKVIFLTRDATDLKVNDY